MKKLLSIVSAMSFVTAVSSTAVSCGNEFANWAIPASKEKENVMIMGCLYKTDQYCPSLTVKLSNDLTYKPKSKDIRIVQRDSGIDITDELKLDDKQISRSGLRLEIIFTLDQAKIIESVDPQSVYKIVLRDGIPYYTDDCWIWASQSIIHSGIKQ